MDYIRSALENAAASGLSLRDCARMSDHAVNMLGVATPEPEGQGNASG